MQLTFEWDEAKNTKNIQKHGISFDEARTVFRDPNSITIYDQMHSQNGDRFIDIDLSDRRRLFVVVYTERDTRIRIISCRKADLVEKRQYEQQKNDDLSEREEEMQPLYDFSGGVRGKHYQAYQQGYRVLIHKTDGTTEVQAFTLPEGAILLDPDVRLYFPDAEAVNHALRELIRLIPRQPLANAGSL